MPNPRVMVTGMPTVTIAGTVGDRRLRLRRRPPATARASRRSSSPCATRVTSNGQPLLLMDSQAICAPTGTPLLPPVTQTRVIGM